MLTSSDAKWRCMWHMFVWSILLTLVSQFLDLLDHVVFYFFAGISILVLPVLTAIYSNTSGKHCAELLRVGYVFCDPVLASLTISPVLLLNRLPKVVDQFFCLKGAVSVGVNQTLECLENASTPDQLQHMESLLTHNLDLLQKEKQKQLFVMEGCIVVPIVLFLLMGRRTRKMKLSTFLLVFVYWFIAALEACALMETTLLNEAFKHVVFTTMAIVSIVMIVTNSYAVVTLCSYISPGMSSTNKHYQKKFDFLYKSFVGVAGVLFAEIPLMVARYQIIFADVNFQIFLPGTFYLWTLKDMLSCILLLCLIYTQKFSKKTTLIPCRSAFVFDSKDVFFQPEKRDRYISRQRKSSPVPATAVLTNENLYKSNLLNKQNQVLAKTQNTALNNQATSSAGSTSAMLPHYGGARLKTNVSKPVKSDNQHKEKSEKSEKKSKRVTFKFDMGLGRTSVVKAREDHHEDVSDS